MKKFSLVLGIILLSGCVHSSSTPSFVFQSAPISALMAGCYDGTTSIRELKQHGDFGIGTLDALDGEMVAFEGSFYQVRQDGKAYVLGDRETSPFATLVFFKKNLEYFPDNEMNFDSLTLFLDEKLPSKNLIYAIQVDGKFKSLSLRSAFFQKKPYPILTEAIKEQKKFELKEMEGVLVGFKFPPYMEGVNVSGYHFHFLSRDRTLGGHVLDFVVRSSHIAVHQIWSSVLSLPQSDEFLNTSVGVFGKESVAQVEK